MKRSRAPCRHPSLWILCFPLAISTLTCGTMFLLMLKLFYLKPSEDRFVENSDDISLLLDDFYECLENNSELECAQEVQSIPFQLDLFYEQYQKTLQIGPNFLECTQNVYEYKTNITTKFAVQIMSMKIQDFKRKLINGTFYCTYVNLIEQPLFCQLEQICAKTNHEHYFLQLEYAKRYIRVMMAQSPHMNNFFGDETMELCRNIAHPYAESNNNSRSKIKDPTTTNQILNINLCECEYCSYSSKLSTQNTLTIILFLIINIFN